MNINDCIRNRRSIRFYKKEVPDYSAVLNILEAAIWAPSGKNLQPWKAKVVTDSTTIISISDICTYSRFVGITPCAIIIFLDKNISYNYVKDVQSCGMLMQNIMLTAHDKGLGTCLVGELTEKGEDVKNILNITDESLELMGVITIGYPRGSTPHVTRKKISEFII